MGGTIARYSEKNHDVLMAIATVPNNKAIRMNESEKSATILGAEICILDIDPEGLIFSRELVRRMDKLINDYSPDIVYTHWIHDSHQDHIAVSNAVIASARKNNCSLYMYEQTIPGGIVPYGFRAQAYVDISNVIDTKVESVMAHKSQVEANDEWWLFGVKGRAMYRGYQIYTKYAEAFEVIKYIKTF